MLQTWVVSPQTFIFTDGDDPELQLQGGHDPLVHGIEPWVGLCTGSTEPAWGFLSPSLSLCPSPTCIHSLSPSQNK
ncbi:Hypothetical predicted protein [Lynx pardinus]|uniref:Uncharacterized protein n=1 Tax=Lynx pardinus TaxID=191816 RepID=A0A485NH75_LYNPA|nr:Hypothetical predicted protein [Lynx pardinus]